MQAGMGSAIAWSGGGKSAGAAAPNTKSLSEPAILSSDRFPRQLASLFVKLLRSLDYGTCKLIFLVNMLFVDRRFLLGRFTGLKQR